MHAGVQHTGLTLKAPHVAAHGSTTSRSLLLFDVSDGTHTGWGEASPLPGYSSHSLEDCQSALLLAAQITRNSDPDKPESVLAQLPAAFPPQARAAVEVALRDLAARRAAVPLWEFLGGTSPTPVSVSRLIGSTDPETAGRQAQEAINDGFTTIKIKVGLADDLAVTAAVRSAVSAAPTLIADANCAWTLDEAARRVEDLVAAGADLIEQPVWGIDAMRSLADHQLPICLDEDVSDPEAFVAPRAAQFACIKLQALGGVDSMIGAAKSAREVGMKVYSGSTLDGPIGIAAALHASVVINPDMASGLATIDAFEQTTNLDWVKEGKVSVPTGIGLGIDPLGTPC